MKKSTRMDRGVDLRRWPCNDCDLFRSEINDHSPGTAGGQQKRKREVIEIETTDTDIAVVNKGDQSHNN